MRHENWIWLDMDGTIANLYSVDNWLADLRAHMVRPYAEATPIYNVYELLTVLAELKTKGYNIGVISWSSKENNPAFDREVEKAKREWLMKYDLDLILDKIIVTAYGIKKANTCRKYGAGILVDDEKQNRDTWDLGNTIDANENIIKKLWDLARNS